MRVNNSQVNKFLFKFKILILLFSFTFNIFTPTFLVCRDRLRSGGQLSFSVLPEGESKNITKKSTKKKSLLANNINSSANIDINVNKEEINKDEKKEVAPEVIQAQQALTEAKLDQKKESLEVKPEIKIDLQKTASQDKKELKRILNFQDQDAGSQKKLFTLAKEQKREQVSEQRYQEEVAEEETVVFNFEDVDLANVAAYVETLFNVKFITDEAIMPMAPNSKALSGNKVSFKTQRPLTKKQAWDLFGTFLNMASLAIVEQTGLSESGQKFYRITPVSEALKSAIPVFINQDVEKLPDSGLVRYGYFVKDCPLDTIKTVLEQLKGVSANLLMLYDHNAFIITDDAYNIKILMKIVKELDNVTMPQTMSVLRLYKGEASYAKKIYTELTAEGADSAMAARLFGPKTVSKTLYFPKKAKMIVDERTNSLILLGTVEDIKTIEDFVRKYIDIDIDAPYSPLYIYDLKYANAVDVATWMNNLVKFGDTNKSGALRSGDKYFKNMNFTAEPENNRIVIKGDYDDYLKAKDIIDQIDEAPKQVAIEILILSVEIQDQKELGAQIRNQFKIPDGTSVNFQTSGITLGSTPKTIQPNTNTLLQGSMRLLGDLINLVSGSSAGTTAVSLGSDKFGVWGIFGVLDKITNTQIVANPFLTVTNNTSASVKLGETIRIVTAEVKSSGDPVKAFDNYDANIEVTVTPKINSDGMIVTDLTILFDSFLSTESKSTRKIQTTVVLSNNETMALGGLLKDRADDNLSQVPILGKIPIIGWFFKNKSKTKKKDDLLFLIHTHIVDPDELIKENTKRHLKEYRDTLEEFESIRSSKDPIDRSLFKDKNSDFKLDNYIFSRGEQENSLAGRNTVKHENYKESVNSKRRNNRRKTAEAGAKKVEVLKEDKKNVRVKASKEDKNIARESRKEQVRNKKNKATKKDNIKLGKVNVNQDGLDKPVAGA